MACVVILFSSEIRICLIDVSYIYYTPQKTGVSFTITMADPVSSPGYVLTYRQLKVILRNSVTQRQNCKYDMSNIFASMLGLVC